MSLLLDFEPNSHVVFLSGSVSFNGGLVKTPKKILDGVVSFVGTPVKTVTKLVAGSVGFVGTLIKSVGKSFTGIVSFNGGLTAQDSIPDGSGSGGGVVTVIAESAENSKLT